MHRNLVLFVSCLSLLVLSSTVASAWEIDGDRVWQNDSNCYISVEPHTLHNSGWVVITVKTHHYSGNLDACLGFNTTVARPSKPAWKNHWENTTTYHQAHFYNVTSIESYSGSNFDYGNNYNTYQRTITYHRPVDWDEETNTTTYELATANVSFDSYEEVGDGDDYVIHWHTDHSEWVEWTRVPASRYHSVTYDFMGFDRWYYATDLTVQAGKEYTLRFWVDVPVSLERSSGKYFFAVKPSTETIGEAVANGHFYYLDPWWDTHWDARRELRINNTGGSELSYYQVFVDLSETPIDATSLRVVNDTAGTTVPHWNESVDANGDVTKLWFNCTHIPADSWLNGTYYIYYINDEASSTSDGDTTFEFFDDFTGTSIDTSKWNDAIAGSYTISDSVINMTGDWNSHILKTQKTDFEMPLIVEKRCRVDSEALSNDVDLMVTFYWVPWAAGGDACRWDNSYEQKMSIHINGTTYTHDYGFSNVAWHRVRATFTSTEFRIWADWDTEYSDTGTPANTVGWLGLFADPEVGRHVYVDWFAVRKYASHEPSVFVGDAEYSTTHPLQPNNLQSSSGLFWDTGKTWINYTWETPVEGIQTDSYNVSLNGIWYNGSSQTYRNTTIDFPEWVNISVYSYNATYGTLSNQSADGEEHALISLATVYRHIEETSQESSTQDNTTVVALLLLCICLVIVGWNKKKNT